MPKVSILAPSYNHEKYITEAIQSVLDQTFQDFELIICDDASTDKTVEKISQFQDPRIMHFSNPRNRGTCATSEACWQKSTGEYIAWLGTDDVYEPHMLETLIAGLEKEPQLLGIFGFPKIIDDDGNVVVQEAPVWTEYAVGLDRFELLHDTFAFRNHFCATAALVRRHAIEKVGYRRPYLLQVGDMEHWARILFQGDMKVIPEVVVGYRVRAEGANLSSAGKLDTRTRTAFEHSKLLQVYVDRIDETELLLQIFPEIRDTPWPVEKRSIPFHLAQMSIAIGNRSNIIFGISLLYDLMADSSTAEYLRQKCNFDYRDLFDLEAKTLAFLDWFPQPPPQHLVEQLDAQANQLREQERQLEEKEHQLEDFRHEVAAIAKTRTWKARELAVRLRNRLKRTF